MSQLLVDAYLVALIGLEELTLLRERTRCRRDRRAIARQRCANGHTAKRAFAQWQGYLADEGAQAGSLAVSAKAFQTGQACPRGGRTAPANHPGKGLVFSCQGHHVTLPVDLVGARSVALRALLVWKDWTTIRAC